MYSFFIFLGSLSFCVADIAFAVPDSIMYGAQNETYIED